MQIAIIAVYVCIDAQSNCSKPGVLNLRRYLHKCVSKHNSIRWRNSFLGSFLGSPTAARARDSLKLTWVSSQVYTADNSKQINNKKWQQHTKQKQQQSSLWTKRINIKRKTFALYIKRTSLKWFYQYTDKPYFVCEDDKRNSSHLSHFCMQLLSSNQAPL